MLLLAAAGMPPAAAAFLYELTPAVDATMLMPPSVYATRRYYAAMRRALIRFLPAI